MPVYEYQCQKCGHEFEQTAKMSDPLPLCPKAESEPVLEIGFSDAPRVVDHVKGAACGGEVKKLISKSSFQLKGGGWYKDGY